MKVNPKDIPSGLPPSQSSSPSATQPPRPSEDIPHLTSPSGEDDPPPHLSLTGEPPPGQNATKEQGMTQDQAAKVS